MKTTTFVRAAMAGAFALGAVHGAQAADYSIRLAHFWPGGSPIDTEIFQAWAETINSESGGRIQVDVYPAQTLSKAPATYDSVTDRIADAGATVQGYTANRFPLTQVVELPGMAETAAGGSCILQTLFDEGQIAGEYEDVHVLFVWTHGPGMVHTKDKLVETPEDFAGLRIRRPTAVVAKMLEELGGAPVGMPAPEIYPSVQRGVIDGATLPWEGVRGFRLNELTTNHTEINMYALTFMAVMNQDVYDDLPDDLKAVIDANSGMKWAEIAAGVFDKLDEGGRAEAVELGHTILTVEGGIENPAWKPALDRATEGYLAELEEKGLPGREVYARALELSTGDCAGQ